MPEILKGIPRAQIWARKEVGEVKCPLSLAQLPAPPTPTSNWVVANRLIQRCYPRLPYMLEPLLSCGVTTFVSLIEPEEFEEKLCEEAQHYEDIVRERAPHAKFIRLQIIDGYIADDKKAQALASDIAVKIKSTDEVFYVHCWGGHGRAETLAALVLLNLGMPCEQALKHVRACHQMRHAQPLVNSPQTQYQYDQVRRLATVADQ